MALTQGHQHGVGAGLWNGMMPPTFTDEVALTGLGDKLENLNRNQ
jgi:hypothetical protein